MNFLLGEQSGHKPRHCNKCAGRERSLYSKQSSNVACRSPSVIPSNFPGWMYPKQMYFIARLPLVGATKASIAPIRPTHLHLPKCAPFALYSL